jgi:tetratricopeptide (TPR) repeat protein
VIGAQIAVVSGDAGSARPRLRAALSQARRADDRRGASLARHVLALVNLRQGRAARAVLHARRTLRIRQQMGDRAAIANTWALLGRAHESRGELSAALESHRRAADTARRIGLRRSLVTALGGMAHVSLLRPRRAGEALAEALEDAGRPAEPSERAVVLVVQGTYLRATGRTDDAADVLREAEAVALESGNQEALGRVALAQARQLRASGDRASTLEMAQRGLGFRELSPDLEVMLLALAAEMAGAPELAQRALDRAAHAEDPRVLAAAQAADARVALENDEPERAASLLRRAAGAAVQCGQRDPFVLRMLLDQARALRRSDPAAADAARRRAVEMAEELLARGYVWDAGSEFPGAGGGAQPAPSA